MEAQMWYGMRHEKINNVAAHFNAAGLDCETAALLRATIRPAFEQSASWTALMDTLGEKGYRLAFRDGRLCVVEGTTDTRICGLRFLGLTLRELVRKLGRPIVIARTAADGDLKRMPPARPG